jgi:CTP synthase
VVCLLEEQAGVTRLGGTMRLGSYPCVLAEGTRARQAYGASLVHERHRHRYEFNNAYRQQFTDLGLVISGTSPDGSLVEVIELANHPWFVAVQCHPEFRSKPTQAHPLFRGLVQASLGRREFKKKPDGGKIRGTTPQRDLASRAT